MHETKHLANLQAAYMEARIQKRAPTRQITTHDIIESKNGLKQ
jgi:hypothetical protein